MSRRGFAAFLMSLGLIGAFALPTLAQDATPQATPPATAMSTTSATPAPTEMSTAAATAVSTAMATSEATAMPTTAPTTAATTEATAMATAMATAEATAMATAMATASVTPPTTVLSGLNNPRGLSFDANGDLFVAEAGAGGSTVVGKDSSGNPITAGLSGEVTELGKDGTKSTPTAFLPSGGSNGEIDGLERVYSRGTSLWLVIGDQGSSNPFSDSVVELDKATGRVKTFIPLYFFEATYNPDGNEINSNVNDIAWSPDGVLYIDDAGGNTIYTWTRTGGLRVFHTWKDDSVPTSIRFGRNGDLYIGFLGQGIAPKAGKIERWEQGKLVETYPNLTAITDIAIGKDGNIYATELAQFGAQGPMPNSGSIIEIVKGAPTTVASGLNAPFGLVQAPDGSWLVTVGSAFAPPGSGAVIKLGAS